MRNSNSRSDGIPRPTTLILGVGNVLLGDEGVGVHVVQAMQSQGLAPNAELFDAGTATPDLLDILAGRDKVIIIDAVKGGGEAGAVYRFKPGDISVQNNISVSAHQVSLLDTLTMARLTGCLPDSVVIFGVEPKTIDWGLDLSPEVAAVIPRVIDLVLAELGKEQSRANR